MPRRSVRLILIYLALAGSLISAKGQVRPQIDDVHHFRLPNGLQILVAVRPELRLAAVNTTVDLGAIDDPPGQWGIAHLLEHVTLQGSATIGSLNPRAEAAALEELDRAYAALDRERRNATADPGTLVGLERWFEQAQQAATKYAEAGEILGGRLESRGAIGLNAATTTDSTHFFTWIPPEGVERWVALEADRLRHPVFRRFYSERSIVLREVTALTGGKATLAERFLQEVFPGGAAAHPLAGNLDQIAAIDRPAALDYFKRFYRPENIVIAVVGNVDPAQIRSLCERYFADWQPEGLHELPRSRRYQPLAPVEIRAHSFIMPQSVAVFFAFPRAASAPSQDAALEALAAMINAPDISPLHRRLVQELGVARTVRALPAYPSQKQTSVFLLQVYGGADLAKPALEREVRAAIKRLSASGDEDLRAGALAAEMRLASQLDDVPTLASLLAFHQAAHGNWRLPFQKVEMLRHLDPEDLRRAAHAMFDGLAADGATTAGR